MYRKFHEWESWNNGRCLNHIHSVLAAMRGLYDSEIDCSISTHWDIGYEARLGNEMDGFKDSKTFYYIEDAMDWLIHRASEIFPESSYARKFNKGIYFI